MAVMYIAEYAELAKDDRGNVVQAGHEPALATQAVTFTTSVASAAFNPLTTLIRVSVDTEAHVKFGDAPTATTSHPQMMADTVEYFGVTGNNSLKIAAVTA